MVIRSSDTAGIAQAAAHAGRCAAAWRSGRDAHRPPVGAAMTGRSALPRSLSCRGRNRQSRHMMARYQARNEAGRLCLLHETAQECRSHHVRLAAPTACCTAVNRPFRIRTPGNFFTSVNSPGLPPSRRGTGRLWQFSRNPVARSGGPHSSLAFVLSTGLCSVLNPIDSTPRLSERQRCASAMWAFKNIGSRRAVRV